MNIYGLSVDSDEEYVYYDDYCLGSGGNIVSVYLNIPECLRIRHHNKPYHRQEYNRETLQLHGDKFRSLHQLIVLIFVFALLDTRM